MVILTSVSGRHQLKSEPSKPSLQEKQQYLLPVQDFKQIKYVTYIYIIWQVRYVILQDWFHVYVPAQAYLTLCNSMDCSLLGSSVHGISRQEYWSGLPFPTPGDLLKWGIKPVFRVDPLPSEPPGKTASDSIKSILDIYDEQINT